MPVTFNRKCQTFFVWPEHENNVTGQHLLLSHDPISNVWSDHRSISHHWQIKAWDISSQSQDCKYNGFLTTPPISIGWIKTQLTPLDEAMFLCDFKKNYKKIATVLLTWNVIKIQSKLDVLPAGCSSADIGENTWFENSPWAHENSYALIPACTVFLFKYVCN